MNSYVRAGYVILHAGFSLISCFDKYLHGHMNSYLHMNSYVRTGILTRTYEFIRPARTYELITTYEFICPYRNYDTGMST